MLHFAVAAHSTEIEEDIDDIAFELEAFLGGGPEERSDITTRIRVGQPDNT